MINSLFNSINNIIFYNNNNKYMININMLTLIFISVRALAVVISIPDYWGQSFINIKSFFFGVAVLVDLINDILCILGIFIVHGDSIINQILVSVIIMLTLQIQMLTKMWYMLQEPYFYFPFFTK
jgi:hypothetical protein